MKNYILTVKHDAGTITIKTTANDEQGAISKVMKAEKCPRRAIVSIKTERAQQ